MSSQQALSSSSSSYQWTYDVFLSFRGEDTRFGFTGYLYNAFCDKNIRTFFDDMELRKGDEITPSLLKAIEESRIAIIVFSENYASSAYCLQELVHILDCLKGNGRLVWPVFYKVDPANVRHHKGSYGEAMIKHEKRFNEEKIQKWRSALTEAANLSGSHYNNQGYEYEFVRKIVIDVFKKIKRCPLPVPNHPVGLDSRVKEVISLLDVRSDKQNHIVGILGVGGVGKTTIASLVYNFIADQFEDHYFLANNIMADPYQFQNDSDKRHLLYLQETLLSEMAGEKNIKLDNVGEGMRRIKSSLHRKKILLVLDNFHHWDQLRAVAGKLDWFGPGSRIIVTTWNRGVLDGNDVERVYDLEELDHGEATELFSWNAFKSNVVDPSFKDILKDKIPHFKGIPLALEIAGSNLFGRPLDEWESVLDSPGDLSHCDFRGVVEPLLRVIYKNYLNKIEKQIFLDIACVFNGYAMSEVKDMIRKHREFSPECGIGTLIDKSLIRVDQSGIVRMHDLIAMTGRKIDRSESGWLSPGQLSDTFLFYEDILDV